MGYPKNSFSQNPLFYLLTPTFQKSKIFKTKKGLCQVLCLHVNFLSWSRKKNIRNAEVEHMESIIYKSTQILAYRYDADLISETLQKSMDLFNRFSNAAEAIF